MTLCTSAKTIWWKRQDRSYDLLCVMRALALTVFSY